MSAVVEMKQPQLPEPVARRGISEAAWRTLANNLFPGADSNSVLMVWDYCVARKLDPLKKPCHIVPMKVKDSKTGDYYWRDVVMPGIYEYRITASRTGQYMGHSKPVYGPLVDVLGRMVPEYCELTVYRWNHEAKDRAEYQVQIFFEEVCATRFKNNKESLNDRWNKAPRQMLTKCTEAAALREAFPDELGGTHTVEEMEGQQVEDIVVGVTRTNPRGDLSGIDNDLVLQHYSSIVDLLHQDKEENDIAQDLRDYVAEHLQNFDELYMCVQDMLKRERIINKKNWVAYLNKGLQIADRGDTHTS